MTDSYTPPPRSSNGNVKWIEKELVRLEGSKVDKAYHKPAMKRLDEKMVDASRKIRELREEMDKDITDIHDTVGKHKCTQQEKIAAMEKSLDFWSTWFIRMLLGVIALLVGGGGTLVYSHVKLTEATKQTTVAVKESRQEVDSIRESQEVQRRTLQRIEQSGAKLDGAGVEKALRQALYSVFADKPQ